MLKTIKLTEAEQQYLSEILLKQIKILADILDKNKAEKYLRKIDKNHAYTIYQKIINKGAIYG